MSCELCVDCDDCGCSGKDCHKIDRCVITDSCFKECEGVGGFIGKIPIFYFYPDKFTGNIGIPKHLNTLKTIL